MNSVVTVIPDALPEATSISLSLPETLTFEQWEEIGAELANRAKKLNWWIGDWWAAGHHRYGERARLAARGLFGKEFKTLANIASVCRAFEPTRRREHLSWSHHAEASALSPAAADMLLDLAERDRMSKAQVRAAVTTIRGTGQPRADADEAILAGIFRAYNRLPEDVRQRLTQALVAANGAPVDPATGEVKPEVISVEEVDLDADFETASVEEPAPETAFRFDNDEDFGAIADPEPESSPEAGVASADDEMTESEQEPAIDPPLDDDARPDESASSEDDAEAWRTGWDSNPR